MKITVLIADDHAMFRDGMRRLLESEEDIQVVAEAADGHEAIRRAKELQPDVAFVDIAMPGLNGLEAVEQIRRVSERTRNVIVSMYSDAEFLARALGLGVSGYLLKGSAGAELVEAARVVCQGSKYFSEQITQKRGAAASAAVRKRTEPLLRLSSREREILQLVVEGESSAEIAERTGLARKTIETYRSRAMSKLGVTNVPELVRFSIQHGLSSLNP